MLPTSRSLLLATFTGLAAVANSAGAELTATLAAKEPPAALGASVRALLAPQAVRVLAGDSAVFEFWFCSEVPVGAKPASPAQALASFKPVGLIGVVSVTGKQHRTYRDTELPEGVYTMRFALQPEDGDHLGTADFPFFVVLIPAKVDTKPDAFTAYPAMVKASGRDTPGGHPLILSLRPAAEGESPKLLEPTAGHKSVRVKATVKPADSAPMPALFEIVIKGKGKT